MSFSSFVFTFSEHISTDDYILSLSLHWFYIFFGDTSVPQHLVHLPFLSVYCSRRTLPPILHHSSFGSHYTHFRIGFISSLFPWLMTEFLPKLDRMLLGCYSGSSPDMSETSRNLHRWICIVQRVACRRRRPHPPGDCLDVSHLVILTIWRSLRALEVSICLSGASGEFSHSVAKVAHVLPSATLPLPTAERCLSVAIVSSFHPVVPPWISVSPVPMWCQLSNLSM